MPQVVNLLERLNFNFGLFFGFFPDILDLLFTCSVQLGHVFSLLAGINLELLNLLVVFIDREENLLYVDRRDQFILLALLLEKVESFFVLVLELEQFVFLDLLNFDLVLQSHMDLFHGRNFCSSFH